VPGGVLARRDEQHAAILHALDRALEEAKLRGIALVVGGVDGEHRSPDLLEPR